MNVYASGRVYKSLQRASEPHHLREAIKLAGEEISEEWFIKTFSSRVTVMVQRATSRKTVELIEEIIDDLEIEIKRRISLKLILIELLVEESKPKISTLPTSENPEDIDNYLTPTEAELMKQRTRSFFNGVDFSEKTDLWEAVEKELILTVLRFHNFNRTKTSKALGISVRTLRNKLSLYLGRSLRDEDDIDSKRNLQ